jgi:hypothetical protein
MGVARRAYADIKDGKESVVSLSGGSKAHANPGENKKPGWSSMLCLDLLHHVSAVG